MKKYISLLFILVCGICSAQNLSFSNVYQAEGKTAQEIYSAVKIWSATAFNQAKSATQVDNPDNYFISFNSNIEYSYGSITMAAYDGWVNFLISVQAKDGRYKVEMTNIVHENKPTAASSCELGVISADENSYKSFNKKVAADIKNKVTAVYDSLCASIQESLNNTSMEDDW